MQRLLARTLGEDIELSTVLADGLPPITMDRSKLEQVLMNAVMNSRAAMPSGGRLTIATGAEDGVRDIVCRILTKAGYEVFAAGDPQEALKLCLDGQFQVDALLSDVIMPGMSGTQLAAELRRSRPGLPVLFMSGYTSGPAPGGQELPPDAPLLHKSFQSPQLLQAMHQLLEA